MRSMIWSAVLVHLKGRAVAFQVLIQSSRAVVSSSSEQNTPRSRQRRCSSANHRSTWLIHDEYVGVKCSWTRGWASSHRCTTGALCADRLSQITWMARPGSVCRSIWSRKSRKSTARLLGGQVADHLAGGGVQRREQVDGAVPDVV